MLVDLDHTECLDPTRVGAKAARLARARAAGLPVLPGVVVPSMYAGPAIRLGVDTLTQGGSGAARLAVMSIDVDAKVLAELVEVVRDNPAIVRSSSAMESGGVWAGAFSTFHDIGPNDVRTAVRGVWASVFSVDALERLHQNGLRPDEVGMAVLVQPQARPDCGGTARVLTDGRVEVIATSGPLGQLMAGWDAGSVAMVDGDLVVASEEVAGHFDAWPLVAAARLARTVLAELGDNTIEWALTDGRVVLLQSSPSHDEDTSAAAPIANGSTSPLARRLALGAVRFPGPLGEQLVLPWLPASTVPLDQPAAAPSTQPLADLDMASSLAAALIQDAWDGENPQPTLRALLGTDSRSALYRLARLRPVDFDRGQKVVMLLEGVAAAVVRQGGARHLGMVWRTGVDELRASLARGRHGAPPVRIGPDRWEPYVHATITAATTPVAGLAAAPGIGAGRVVVVENPHALPSLGGREVIVSTLPVPSLAPLLWSASALVTSGGSRGAHLFEVARSLGVPAVAGARLDEGGVGPGGAAGHAVVAAVDGHHGMASFLRVDETREPSS
ncbi:MAG: PEP/pyruvate-binding domain-containing protein [Acidimicrobiales bacterium]